MKRVFTYGKFEVLHYGHMYFLEEAKKLGDILVVGVYSDKVFKKLFGRAPVFDEGYRKRKLEELDSVNRVFILERTSVAEYLRFSKPSVIARSTENQTERIPSLGCAGGVSYIPYIEHESVLRARELIAEFANSNRKG